MQNNVEQKFREAPFVSLIKETKATKKREAYYSKMSLYEITAIITKQINNNIFDDFVEKTKCYFKGIDDSTDALIAFKVFYEKGGNSTYFTSSTGTSGNCCIM